jgi:hypothetical protein
MLKIIIRVGLSDRQDENTLRRFDTMMRLTTALLESRAGESEGEFSSISRLMFPNEPRAVAT